MDAQDAKVYEDLKKKILKELVKADDNVYDAHRAFIATSVLTWIFHQKELKTVLYKYLVYIEKYINKEIDLYWEDGMIKLRPINQRGKKNGS